MGSEMCIRDRCIVADKAAKDLKEEILQEIRKDGNEIRIVLEALP